MADNTITIEHVIKGSDSSHGNVDISSILQQQNSLLQTLNTVLGKMEQAFIKEHTVNTKNSNGNDSSGCNVNGNNSGNNQPPNNNQPNPQPSNNDVDINKYIIKGAIGGLLTGVAQYASKYVQAETGYIMANASSRGSFAQATIMGRAMEQYPEYKKQLVENEKQKTIAQTTAKYEAPSTGVGTAIGTTLGYLIGSRFGMGAKFALYGGTAGAYVGDNVGKYFASKETSKISQQYDVKSAEEQRDAMLRTGMWTSSLARFNNRKGADTQGFMDRYGKDQNVLGIQNGIAPYMNSAFNEHDLSGVAQNFLKAGYSVDQFAKLTLQATQYQVISGKDIKQFSEDMKQARAKYGAGYDLGTNQTAIDLMTKGVKPEEAQKVAYQSQFNPSVLQNVNSFLGNDKVSFEMKRNIGDMLGIDILETERTGNLVATDPKDTEKLRKRLQGDWDKYNKSGKKDFGYDYTVLGTLGIAPGTINQWTSGSPEGYKGEISKDAMDSSKNEAQQAGSDIIQAIQQGLANVGSVNINAGQVTVVNGGGSTPTKGSGGSPAHSLPFPF